MEQVTEPKSLQESGGLTWPWRARLWRTGLSGATLVLLVAIVYCPAIHNDFVSDDGHYVKRNVAIRSLDGLSDIWFKLDTIEQYYPLVLSTFWVEYHLWGLDPAGYHVVNLLLHAASAVLVWRLLVRLGVPGAWLAAAIFAVHPIEVDSIVQVHERKNVLSLVLALGSLLAYLRFSPPEIPGAMGARAPTARGRWFYYAAAFVLYVAALLAKTVTASVPAVLLLIYWWKRGRVTWRDVARTAPFFAVGLALAVNTVRMEKALGAHIQEWDWDFSLVERVLIAGRALWFYAGKLVWPHPLICAYPRWVIDARAWWQYLFPVAAVSVIVALWLARKRIGRGPLAAVLIFAGVLTPGLGFFDVFFFPFTFVVDHIQYHAGIALIALVTAAAVLAARRLPKQARWFAPVAGVALLVPLAVVAQQRTRVYQNDIILVEDLVAQDPQSWVGHHALGRYLEEKGKYEEALSHFRKAIEIRGQLARDNPTLSNHKNEVARFYVDVGLVERQMGRSAEEEIAFRKAIEIREKLVRDHPTVTDYQDGLAWCYSDLAYVQKTTSRVADAEASHRRAIEIREKLVRDNPTRGDYMNQAAAVYADLGLLEREVGRSAEAENSLRQAIEIREQLVRDHPTVAEYPASLAASYQDLAISQQTAGRPVEAVASHRRAIEIRRKLVQDNGRLMVAIRVGSAEIRQKLAQDDHSVSNYQNDLAASYVDVGLLERDMGRAAEAASDFRQAITIREKLVLDHPAVSAYQDGLAWCYLHLADALQKTEQPDEAETFNRKAIEIRQKLAPPEKTEQ